MAANADDQRYFYSFDLGPSQRVVVNDNNVGRLEELTPGRYALSIQNFGGATGVWLFLGDENAKVLGAPGIGAMTQPPSIFIPAYSAAEWLARPDIEFHVKGVNKRAGGALLAGEQELARDRIYYAFVGGPTAAAVQLTKVSRGKG